MYKEPIFLYKNETYKYPIQILLAPEHFEGDIDEFPDEIRGAASVLSGRVLLDFAGSDLYQLQLAAMAIANTRSECAPADLTDDFRGSVRLVLKDTETGASSLLYGICGLMFENDLPSAEELASVGNLLVVCDSEMPAEFLLDNDRIPPCTVPGERPDGVNEFVGQYSEYFNRTLILAADLSQMSGETRAALEKLGFEIPGVRLRGFGAEYYAELLTALAADNGIETTDGIEGAIQTLIDEEGGSINGMEIFGILSGARESEMSVLSGDDVLAFGRDLRAEPGKGE